jgi:hypothetical protein
MLIVGEHSSTLSLSPLAYYGTSTNKASGEVYAPGLGTWLEISTPIDVVANYEISIDNPFFNRSAGEHRLEDSEGNYVSIGFTINESTTTQYIDYDLNGGIQWQVNYQY